MCVSNKEKKEIRVLKKEIRVLKNKIRKKLLELDKINCEIDFYKKNYKKKKINIKSQVEQHQMIV